MEAFLERVFIKVFISLLWKDLLRMFFFCFFSFTARKWLFKHSNPRNMVNFRAYGICLWSLLVYKKNRIVRDKVLSPSVQKALSILRFFFLYFGIQYFVIKWFSRVFKNLTFFCVLSPFFLLICISLILCLPSKHVRLVLCPWEIENMLPLKKIRFQLTIKLNMQQRTIFSVHFSL